MMAKAALFLIDGFEETEAVSTADILRRGEVDVTTVSLTGRKMVTGKHDITVRADALFEKLSGDDWEAFDVLVIPGGTTEYVNHKGLLDWVRRFDAAGKQLAAICAAPVVFAEAGILQGRTAVCYPGMESRMTGAVIGRRIVEIDGHITTSKGPGMAPFFGLAILENLRGTKIAKDVARAFLYPVQD